MKNDSNMIASMLEQAGHIACSNLDEADIIIINTCCIRQSAENRALGFIGSSKGQKELKPDCLIAVCGCLPQMDKAADNLAAKYRHLDIIIGTYATALLPQYIEDHLSTGQKDH